MEELIEILRIGFFEGIFEAFENNSKKYNYIIDKEFKSKAYDFAFVLGYNSVLNYIKNKL